MENGVGGTLTFDLQFVGSDPGRAPMDFLVEEIMHVPNIMF